MKYMNLLLPNPMQVPSVLPPRHVCLLSGVGWGVFQTSFRTPGPREKSPVSLESRDYGLDLAPSWTEG